MEGELHIGERSVSMLRKYNAGKVIETKITQEFREGREDAEMWGWKGLEQIDW